MRIVPNDVEARLLIAAGFCEDRPAIRWLGNTPLQFVIGLDEPKRSHPNW